MTTNRYEMDEAGMTSIDDIDALDAQVDGYIEAVNSGIGSCPAFSPTDKLAWQGVYEGWKQLHGYWAEQHKYAWGNLGLTLVLLTFGQTLDQMRQYQAEAEQYAARLAHVCAGSAPVPMPTDQPSGGGGASAPVSWPAAVEFAAVAAVVVALVYAFGPAARGLGRRVTA
jgi:hypothetical protein